MSEARCPVTLWEVRGGAWYSIPCAEAAGHDHDPSRPHGFRTEDKRGPFETIPAEEGRTLLHDTRLEWPSAAAAGPSQPAVVPR